MFFLLCDYKFPKMSRARWLENKISPNVVRRATTSHIMQKSKEGDNVPSRYTRKTTFEYFFFRFCEHQPFPFE